MAAASRGTTGPVNEARTEDGALPGKAAAPQGDRFPSGSVAANLFAEPFAFDFFQAVRVLERLYPQRRPVGRANPPRTEVVRFRAHLSLSFPPSAIYDLEPPADPEGLPVLTVAFMGLYGPSGILPRHYTERLLYQHFKDSANPERYALRAWFDLFNHRMIALHFRAWEKYRFSIPFERGAWQEREPDSFTRCLYSFLGLGEPSLRNRLRVGVWEEVDGEPQERTLARIPDLALLYYGGYLSHRPRCAVALEAMLQDYFGFAVRVLQFQGQWFQLEPSSQSRMGGSAANNELGVNLIAGDRVWDVQNKIRLRIGPLSYAEFSELLPDRQATSQRKLFFVLSHLVRLYVGPELDFDVQLVLRARDVPACQLGESASFTPRLGWNTWMASQPYTSDADEPVFEGEEVRWLNSPPALSQAG
jgi:type VI secretion system protein ImpH